MLRAWQRTELQYGKFIKHTNNRDNNTILNWLMKPNSMAYRGLKRTPRSVCELCNGNIF